MDLSELTAYASEKYQIQEEHRWKDFPGYSVLCHPQTGKWIALLIRQWDTETGTEIERCDLKCGSGIRFCAPDSCVSAPIRIRGDEWIDIAFDDRTESELVFRLFDRAIRINAPHGHTVVLNALTPSASELYQETPLPFAGDRCQPHREKQPEQIREMLRLFEDGSGSEEARARNFYKQAVFMQDYEDNVPWSGEFIRYFPTYQDLTVRKLRGYFTWRAGVRRGVFQPIATSAAYIYLYELLNGVGADSPEDVLKKLRAFEVGYIDSGIGDTGMRSNLRRWMLEYGVVNDVPPELVREYADPDMMAQDASIAVLRKPGAFSDDEIFSALCVFGGKKIAESPVIQLDPPRGRHLFGEVWRSAAASRWQNGKIFPLFFGERKTRRWYPLANAVYYEQKQPEDRNYVLNECRSFRCRKGLWTVRAFVSLSFHKERWRGFLHETDAKLRRYLKVGHYLRERAEDDWVIPFIDAAIEADRQALMEAARPNITIDLSGLEQIRRDASTTRESLLTEDEIEEAEQAPPPAKEDETSAFPLDPIQIRILQALLDGQDPMKIMKAEHLMPSMAADAINEALFEAIGDTVLLCEDDRLLLAEDYREELEELLGGTDNG